MQIEIYTPTQAQPLPPVQWNYAEVKQWIEDGLAAYKGRVYTEDMITAAKKDRAALNKLADAIDTKRKEMKALYLQPYEEFEAQAKELTAMVKEQALAIDTQVKAYDEAKKAEKLEKIKAELYAPMIGKLAELVPYERLHDPKWLNVSTSMSAVSEQLGNKIDRIEAGLSSIDKLDLAPDITEQVKGVFLKNYDLAAALAEKERIEKRREELARYEAAKAEVKAAVEEGPQVYEASDPEAFAKAKPGDVIQFGGPGCVPAISPAPLHTVIFKVEATAEQLSALKNFLKSNNIKYGRA